MTTPFSETWVLVKVDSRPRLMNGIKLAKLFNGNIYPTVDKPILKIVGIPNSIRTSYYDKYPESYCKVLDCALNHYTIIKSAYSRGLQNILIIEDDLNVVDCDILSKTFDQIPEDFDVIKFWSTGYYNNKEWNGESPLYNSDREFVRDDCSTLCYALSRKGMKLYLDYQDKDFKPADIPFYYMKMDPNCKYYSLNYTVGVVPLNLKSEIVKE